MLIDTHAHLNPEGETSFPYGASFNAFMLIDIHAHLNFNAYKSDADKVISQCLENNVWMINIGTNFETSKKAVEISQKYEKGVFASVGLHPINLDTGLVKIKVDESEGSHFEKEFDFEKYKELAKSQKVVAIGEIGLDYYWKPKTKRKLELFKEKQRTVLCQQLNLARELNLPVIFHCRMAHEDLLEILNEQRTMNNEQLKGVMHGFVGTTEQLQEYLKMGLYIGFNGIIFKKIEGINFEELIKETPIEKILIETDCPYLTPPNFPEERNNPLGVKQVAQEIAEIKNLSFEKVAEITTKNAKELFKI
jgi:TatD DNase family protein